MRRGKQANVLRVPKSFRLTLRDGTALACEEAVKAPLRPQRRWEVRSAGKGSKGSRWYAWAWIAAASGTHSVLVRRHLKTGEPAFHYCYVPEGQPCSKPRPIRAAGLRWPAEEDSGFGRDQFGLHESQVRTYTAIVRHTVLTCAALAICAVAAALLRDEADTQAAPLVRPDQALPSHPGLIPLTVPQIRRLLAAATAPSWPPGHAEHWDTWIRCHQARSRWFHKRARLARDASISLVS